MTTAWGSYPETSNITNRYKTDDRVIGNLKTMFGTGAPDQTYLTTSSVEFAQVTVDNLVINANDISSTSGNLTLSPFAGSAVVIDAATSFDGGAVTGMTSLEIGDTTFTDGVITQATGGPLNIALSAAAGDDFTVDTDKLVVEGDTGNIGVGVTAFGTNATNVIAITADGTIPSSSPAGQIAIFADDSTGGAANATLAFRTEETVATEVLAGDSTLNIWINSVEYHMILRTV